VKSSRQGGGEPDALEGRMPSTASCYATAAQNWSAAGRKRRRTTTHHFTNDPAEVKTFEQEFEEMWNAQATTWWVQ